MELATDQHILFRDPSTPLRACSTFEYREPFLEAGDGMLAQQVLIAVTLSRGPGIVASVGT